MSIKLKNIKINLLNSVLISLTLFIMSCGAARNKFMVSSKTIVENLNATKGQGILFGHQDALAYGFGWRYLEDESDVKRVAGDYPAIFGWELGGIEMGHTFNLDTVPFDTMRALSLKAYNLGGINTFSWHPYSAVDGVSAWNREAGVITNLNPGGSHHEEFKKQLDKLADFLISLKTPDGKQIPFIFRPWHEMDGDWFWWGSKQSTPKEFKTFFKFTINYLKKERGITNMLIAYSPDSGFNTLEEYYTWFPGRRYVDIMGMDNYRDLRSENGTPEAIKKLHVVIEAAIQKNKFAALTETGLENVTDSTWFTQKLGVILEDPIIAKELSYVMVWRSDDKVHFFFPYPGHPAAEDAKEFLTKPEILLLGDFNKLKNK